MTTAQERKWLTADQAVALAGLAGVSLLAWAWLFRDAARMASMESMGDSTEMGGGAGAMAGMSGMAMPVPFDPVSLGLTFMMWAIMMVAMMLPSASPAILLYGALARKRREQGSAVAPAWIFTSGYIAVWTAFSALAAILQAGLQEAALLTPMLVSQSRWLSGALLVVAGVYQWLPYKDVCLQKCRAPLQFFMFSWRAGHAGAFRMGMEHGAFCLGCCWALMLLLFVAGVMNLVWVALIAAFVLVEKLAPGGGLGGRIDRPVMLAGGQALATGLVAGL
jgi:predicted metal-binding membrane protein